MQFSAVSSESRFWDSNDMNFQQIISADQWSEREKIEKWFYCICCKSNFAFSKLVLLNLSTWYGNNCFVLVICDFSSICLYFIMRTELSSTCLNFCSVLLMNMSLPIFFCNRMSHGKFQNYQHKLLFTMGFQLLHLFWLLTLFNSF